MNTVRLYNTMSRRVEELVPVRPGEVGLYCCGPTVYDYAHIGNLRKYVCDDLLRRTLEHAGYAVRHVMNVTDIDDKIIKAAPGGIDAIRRHTTPFREAFFEDTATLSILRPHVVCAATEHIDAMAALVAKLVESGHAYESEGSYYFRIAAYPEYGRLARLDTAGMMAGARVDVDEYEKGDVRDFALWKAARPDEPVWDTPIGPGRPGWHIECSAMSMEYLGEEFDIHTGGVDNMFPHHENEIAQSCATGAGFVRVWLHHEHLLVEGRKMAKSLGNFFTLRDLLSKGHDPRGIRYLYLSHHNRSQLNFTFDGLAAAERTVDGLVQFMDRLEDALPSLEPGGTALSDRVAEARQEFFDALYDDLQAPQALARLHDMVRDVNASLAEGSARAGDVESARAALVDFDSVLGVLAHERASLDADVERLIAERQEARARRDFARSDAIRDELLAQGIVLEDTPAGVRWRKA